MDLVLNIYGKYLNEISERNWAYNVSSQDTSLGNLPPFISEFAKTSHWTMSWETGKQKTFSFPDDLNTNLF